MEPGEVVNGKYRIVRLLGEGGMGAVYEVQHEVIGQRFALKVLHSEMASYPEYVERFIREAQAATKIGSDHIVYVTDGGYTDDGAPYIVMEYLDGESLAELMMREAPISIQRSVDLITQVCDAVGAAHGRGIIHRDLKPENLFVVRRRDGSEWIKVLDFGIAKILDTPEGMSLTCSGASMGTPHYMAPEQLHEAKHVDERADIYSTGVLLFQLLTAERPFQAKTIGELVIELVTADPQRPRSFRPELSEELEAAVLKAIARDPDDRYTALSDLADALALAVGPAPAAKTAPEQAPTVPAEPSASAPLQPELAVTPHMTSTPEARTETWPGPEKAASPRPSSTGTNFRILLIAVFVGLVALIGGAIFGVLVHLRNREDPGLREGAGESTSDSDVQTPQQETTAALASGGEPMSPDAGLPSPSNETAACCRALGVAGSWGGSSVDRSGNTFQWMLVLRQDGCGLEGTINWLGTSGSDGTEHVRGQLRCDRSFRLDGYRIEQGDSSNLTYGDYQGSFSQDLSTMSGFWTNGEPGTFTGLRR